MPGISRYVKPAGNIVRNKMKLVLKNVIVYGRVERHISVTMEVDG